MLQRGLVALVLAGLSLLPGVPSAVAATRTVDVAADTYDGSCADGDCSLRDAIASAGPDGIVLVPPGFYALTVTEAGAGPADGSIEIGDGLSIRGIGETGAFIDASALGTTPFLVGGGVLRLRDLTLFGARTDDGAGVAEVQQAALVLHRVTITRGRGDRAGAIVVGSGGGVSMWDSLLLANRSPNGAGAVRVGPEAQGLRAIGSAFIGNRGRGGGALRGSDLRIGNVTFARNVASGRGGAILGGGAWSQVTFTANRAARGGAVAVLDPGVRPTADHVVIAGNVSGRGGQCEGRLRSWGWNVVSGSGCGFTRPTDVRGVDPGLQGVTANGGPTPTAAFAPGSVALDLGGACASRDQRGAPRDDACDAGAYERVLCRGRAVDVVGTAGDDDLAGGRARDTFLGLGGDDVFQGSLDRDRACGGDGDDHLIGGPAEDVLVGGDGDDVLDGEGGVDRCLGGPGRDRRVDCEG